MQFDPEVLALFAKMAANPSPPMDRSGRTRSFVTR